MSKSGYKSPQRRRNYRRGIAISLILICIVILLADRQQRSMLTSGRLSADNVSSKIMGFIATPIRGIETLFVDVGNRKNAYEDNVILRAEIKRLRNFENKVLDLEMRVRQFETMLDMESSSDLPDNKVIARAVSESRGPFVHSALINIGLNKGINVGNAVMTSDGLYGHIISTGSVSARVLLLNDLSSRISVMSQRSLARAILVGNNTNSPKLAYVSQETDWQAGDRIVTSGDGGVLPRGLLIGTLFLDNDNSLNVDLYYQSNPVDWVWVYPFTPIPAPEEVSPIQQIAQDSLTPETDVQEARE